MALGVGSNGDVLELEDKRLVATVFPFDGLHRRRGWRRIKLIVNDDRDP